MFQKWRRATEKAAAVEAPAPPVAEQVLQAGDVLVFHTDTDSLPGLWAKIGLEPAVSSPELKMETERYEHHLVEVVVAPSHPTVGRYVSELPVREAPPYKAEIVAVSRNGRPVEGPILEMRIEAGDNAILEVEDNFFYETRDETEFALTNMMVQGPGGYKFMDFVKVGLPLTVVVGIVAILLAPLVYGF